MGIQAEDEHNISIEMDAHLVKKSDAAAETAIEQQQQQQQQQEQDDNSGKKIAAPVKSARIATLDVFRGFTVALMVLVDDAGGQWPRINHSPWNGCTLADLVMPFFLFIVGVAIALAMKKIPRKAPAVKKVVLRFFKLIFWGLLLQGGYSHAPDDLSYGVDIKQMRWCGILQRIAFAYLIVALVEIATTKTSAHRSFELPKQRFAIFRVYKYHWLTGLVVLFVYHIVAYTLLVPDWHFWNSDGQRLVVKCGVRGDIGPACNAVGHIDRVILGITHLYKSPEWVRTQACDLFSPADGPAPANAPTWCQAPFEPEGILSSISSILSCIIGIHYGHVLIHYKDQARRLMHWGIPAACLLLLATIVHFTHVIPLNKQLYSFSYVCFTAGAAGMVFCVFYVVIDILGFNKPTLPLQWIGMNAMFVFVMAASGIFAGIVNGLYWETPGNNLVNWIKRHIFINVWHSVRVGTLLYVLIAEILFWGLVSGLLHWRGIYWKL